MKKTNKSGTNQTPKPTAKPTWEADEIPALPEPLPHELAEHDIDLHEFLRATNRIIIYSAPDGEPKIRFDKLDADCYANGVAILSAPWNRKALEHLKLILEGVRLVLAENKKSFQNAIRVEKCLQKTTTSNKAEAEKELARLEVVERVKPPGEPERRQASLDELRRAIMGEKPENKEPPKDPLPEPPKGTLF